MVEPVTPLHPAEIVLVPTPAAWASPRELGASEIVTTESEEEDQLVCLVRSRLMPSLKLPTQRIAVSRPRGCSDWQE